MPNTSRIWAIDPNFEVTRASFRPRVGVGASGTDWRIALAKLSNAKLTIVNVTEPCAVAPGEMAIAFPIDNMK